MREREHDGADHGDEQDQPRDLEVEDVARVEHEPQRLRIGDAGCRCSARSVRGADAEAAADEQQHQLGQHDAADEQTDGRVLDEAGFQLGEIDVEHHDDEQEQHRHRADVDDDEDHRQELGAQQHEEPGRVEEGEDQIQHRVHGILRHDHHDPGDDRKHRKQIEEPRRQSHRLRPTALSRPPPRRTARVPAASRRGNVLFIRR